MTHKSDLSMLLNQARKQIKKAHQTPDMCPEDMGYTAETIDNLGIQHYGRAGEDLPNRIIEAHVCAMADLTFAYGEQAYYAEDDELTFFDESQRETFNEHVDKAHDAAMTAFRIVEDQS